MGIAGTSDPRRASRWLLAGPALATLLVGCAGPGTARVAPRPASPCAPHDCVGHASQQLAFEAARDRPRGFFCLAPGTPERDPRGGQCLPDRRACVELAAHLMRSYRRSEPGRCVEQPAAHCFQQISWGTRMEICYASDASCEAHRATQARDDRVTEITATCQARGARTHTLDGD